VSQKVRHDAPNDADRTGYKHKHARDIGDCDVSVSHTIFEKHGNTYKDAAEKND